MVSNELNLQKELADAQRQSDESLKIVEENGFVLDTSQWLTIKRYAEKHGVNMQEVGDWITRGIIPIDCVRDLPEINNIRLVRDQPYR